MPMRSDTIQAIKARIASTRVQRQTTLALLRAGKDAQAEPDATRGKSYSLRVDKIAGHKEAVRGTNDFLRAAFLSAGERAHRAVAHVRLNVQDAAGGSESRDGTGFLISPSLFITNQHVINNEADARVGRIIFDDEYDETGQNRPTTIFALDPDTFFLASPETDLDFAVIAVGERLSGARSIAEFGYCPLSDTPDRHRLGIAANIVQHPNGEKKQVVIRNNIVSGRTDPPDSPRLFYETDTEEGSSGSPVFNDMWDVIALHHYGEASVDVTLPDGKVSRSVNEGIRISAIYERLTDAATNELTGAKQALLRAALVLWKTDRPSEPRLVVRPKETSPAEAQATSAGARAKSVVAELAPGQPGERAGVSVAAPMQISHNPGTITPGGTLSMVDTSLETTFVIPVEVTIRIGRATPAAETAAQKPEKVLKLASLPSLAEAAKIDRDYSNRNGFDPKFVAGLDLDLDEITAPLKKKIAPLREESRKRANGELAYQNFSVVMHKSNRVALLTATNIDGPTYIAIDRKTGEPAADQPRPEGDSWYTDPRIDESYILTNDFYSQWSHLFDRGHLTRRNDPTWGDDAARANKDTFHFTNCSPQHWKFNESIEFWQGVERYVLEQGLWEAGFRRALTVLQGPLYDGNDNLFADDVPVPCAFWKIVVWKGAAGLKAVALIVDQTNLLSITRHGSKSPDESVRADVTEFRSTVAEVARRSGLAFDDLVKFDTAKDDLPHVGEASRPLTSWSQIKLA